MGVGLQTSPQTRLLHQLRLLLSSLFTSRCSSKRHPKPSRPHTAAVAVTILQALASLVSCVEWGASVGLSGLRGHPGGGAAEGQEGSAPSPLPAAEGLVCLGSGFDRLGGPLVVVRLGGLTHSLVEACGKKALLRCELFFFGSVPYPLAGFAGLLVGFFSL